MRGASWKIPTSREGREKWGTRQSGENCLTPLGADQRVGILRLRMRIHKANPHASLRMTVRWGASSKIPTSREGREKWGTRQSGENCLTPLVRMRG